MGMDPGTRGSLSILHADMRVLMTRAFAPEMTQKALVEIVREGANLLTAYGSHACFIEKVGYIGGDGPKCPACGKKSGGDGGKGANTFGRVDGILRGAALALNLDLYEVSPMIWQARMECVSGGNKNVTKLRALELFPAEKITHATADGLLIAEYGRRRFFPDLDGIQGL